MCQLWCGAATPAPPPVTLPANVTVDFSERDVDAETAGTFIDSVQSTLMALMTSANLPAADRIAAGWLRGAVQPTTPDTELVYGYVKGEQGPVVVTICQMPGVDADALFRFLTSVEGFQVIDPDTTNHHRPPVEVLTPAWRDRAEITHAIAKAVLPFTWRRTFCVLNAMDHNTRLFTSWPVLHVQHPKEAELTSKYIRARNVWASWCQPTPKGCVMTSLCWLDLGGSFPPAVTAKVMTDKFMQAYHVRLHKHVHNAPSLWVQAAQAEPGDVGAAEKPSVLAAHV